MAQLPYIKPGAVFQFHTPARSACTLSLATSGHVQRLIEIEIIWEFAPFHAAGFFAMQMPPKPVRLLWLACQGVGAVA